MRGVTKIYLSNVAERAANVGIKASDKKWDHLENIHTALDFRMVFNYNVYVSLQSARVLMHSARPKDLHTRAQKTTCFYDCRRATKKAGGKAYI